MTAPEPRVAPTLEPAGAAAPGPVPAAAATRGAAGGPAEPSPTDAAERAPEPSPWRDRRFLVFAAGNTLNNIGEAVYAVALPLLVYDMTGSLTVMSLLAIVVPASMLLGPWLGVVVDRWGSRVMVVPGLLVQLAAALALNVVGLSGRGSIWLLFVLAVLIQLGGISYQTGWMVGVARMFPDCPARARGTLSSLFVATRIAGAILFAAALPALGYRGLLWLNVLTFLAPIAVWLMGIHPPRVPAGTATARARLLPDLAEGWRILRSSELVVFVSVIELPVLFVSSAGTTALIIFQLRSHWQLGASAVAAILTSGRIAGLLGTLVVSQRKSLMQRSAFVVAAVGISASLFIMAAPWLGTLIVGMAVLSTLQSAMAVSIQMVLFRNLPAHAIGRISGLLNLVSGVPTILAPLIIPLLSAVVGVEGAFAVLGLLALAAFPYVARRATAQRQPAVR
ncbi:MAG TPA: MFS transporter [Jatrophihabitans sp.]|nr:MFS transporter [Jatrophihabitans sp.]